MDSAIEQKELEEFGLLFILEEPMVKLDNGQQANAILVLDAARHKLKSSQAYRQMSLVFKDGHPINDRQRGDVVPARTAVKRPIEYVLVTDKELKVMESARNVRMKVDELLRDLVDVTSTPKSALHGQSLYPSHPTCITAAPVFCVDPGPRRSVVVVPQRGISAEEDQSLIDLCLTNGSEIVGSADYMYCMELRLAPTEGNPLHSDILGPGIPGRIYRACIDTSDTSFWLYQDGFLRRTEHGYLELQSTAEKTTLPPGPGSALKERAQIDYQDLGWCGLQRWDIEKVTTPLEVPLWKWSSNSQSKAFLNFPRVLVEKANPQIIAQPYDGTFGLGVPGSRYPWKSDTGPEERTTVFDVLLNEGRSFVPTPFRMTLRLLWPLQTHSVRTQQVRSFLYFGKGNPCGISGSDAKLLSPAFGPKIPIEEALDLEGWCGPGERHFRSWTVRLLSMTLLVPLVLPPNYGSSGAPYWEARTISLPNMDGLGGMRAELDCASARSYVPISVYNDIRSAWLHQPNTPGAPGWAQDMFLPDATSFQNHDIVFRFKGTGDNEIEFRCSAEHFLVSPWFVPEKGGFAVPFKAVRTSSHDERAPTMTLGMNFFWSAIVRFDAEHRGIRPVPGIDEPYVRLAAQRIVKDGKVVAAADDIEIHRDAPPRVQAAVRKQLELLR